MKNLLTRQQRFGRQDKGMVLRAYVSLLNALFTHFNVPCLANISLQADLNECEVYRCLTGFNMSACNQEGMAD